MNYIKGIDVSKWQANKIDYKAAKNAGYDFVFIRIGYNNTKDAYFESNYTKAKSAGMKIGVYFYTTKLTVADAKNDANRVLEWLGNKALDMPIAYDMEEASMKLASRKDTNANQYNAFANVVRSKGYVPMLYTGEYMFKTYFNKDLITDHLWIAKYSANDGNVYSTPNVGKEVAIHQYTSAAVATDFYTDKLDRNIMLISYEELMKKASTNSSSNTSVATEKLKVSSNIKAIQTWLNTYYNTGLVVDGIYGAKTKTGLVKAWQTEVGGLLVDGEFGAKSKEKAKAHVIKKGSKGILVTIWQAYLVCKGYNPNGIDGTFGNGCYKSTVDFQRNNKITVDGIVGASTWFEAFK